MSLSIPSLAATCWVFTHLCIGMESQEVIRVRPSEFIRPKQTKIWPYKGRALHWSYIKRKVAFILEPHNSVCLRFCQEFDLSRAGPSGVSRMGLVDLQ